MAEGVAYNPGDTGQPHFRRRERAMSSPVMLNRTWSRLLAIVAVTAPLICTGTATASAAPVTPRGCAPDKGYSYSNVSTNTHDLVPSSRGQGGHTLSIQLQAGASITATIGGSVSGEVNAIVAGARADVNASISGTLSASATYGDSWTVPSSWTWGTLHAGASRDAMNWEYGYYEPTCSYHRVRGGSANMPYHLPTFWSTKG